MVIALVRGEPGDLATTLSAVPTPRPLWMDVALAWVAVVSGDACARDLHAEFGDTTLDRWSAAILADALSVRPLDSDSAAPAFASRLLDALGPVDRGWLVVGSGAVSAGPLALHAARLAIVTGDLAAMGHHLTVAALTVGETPWRPWWHLHRARWLLDTGEAGAAVRELKTARATAIARDLSPLVTLIDATIAEAREPLTGREQEVLDMALAGVPARLIAERLSVGVRTVETHIANIYRKMGVRSRVELMARFAAPGSRAATS
jgi:DNA-binding CsgD family transcriptional regulator